MATNEGLAKIVRDVGAAAEAAVAEGAASAGEQLGLDLVALAPPSRLAVGSGARIRAEADIAEAGRVRALGRPKGAQNIATKQAKAWIIKVFGDPMIESARWLLHTPASMASELDCTLVEAFDRQQRIREALLPFLHAKLAPVGEDGRPLPLFQLILGGADSGAGAGLAPWLDDPEVLRTLEAEDQRNQGLSAEAEGKSQTEKSHAEASD